MQEILLLEWSGPAAAGPPAGSFGSASTGSADGSVPAEDDEAPEEVGISADGEQSGFVLLPMIGVIQLEECVHMRLAHSSGARPCLSHAASHYGSLSMLLCSLRCDRKA